MKRILNILDRLICIIIVAILISMVFSIMLQVFTRYVIGKPLSWTEELARRMMVWLVFITVALAYRRNSQVGIDIITKKLPAKISKHVFIFTDICIIFFSIFMVIYGNELVSKGMNQFSSAIGIKMGYIYTSIPVGGILLIVFAIEKIVNRLQNTGKLGLEV